MPRSFEFNYRKMSLYVVMAHFPVLNHRKCHLHIDALSVFQLSQTASAQTPVVIHRCAPSSYIVVHQKSGAQRRTVVVHCCKSLCAVVVHCHCTPSLCTVSAHRSCTSLYTVVIHRRYTPSLYIVVVHRLHTVVVHRRTPSSYTIVVRCRRAPPQARRRVHVGGGGAADARQAHPAPVALHRPVQAAAARAARTAQAAAAVAQGSPADGR